MCLLFAWTTSWRRHRNNTWMD